MMTYQTFLQLYREAHDYEAFDMYVGERGWQSWMDAYGEDAEGAGAIHALLTGIWDAAKGGVRAIRKATGLSQVAFAKKYEIPARSIENWESGDRSAPVYVIALLAYAVIVGDGHGAA